MPEFENLSQQIFTAGGAVYTVGVFIFRFISQIFSALFVLRDIRGRTYKNKFLWVAFTFVSPFWGLLAYFAYSYYKNKMADDAFIQPKKRMKGFWAIGISAFSALTAIIITALSVVTMGIGGIRSVVADEPLVIYYDMHGNEYEDRFEVPLYDRNENEYIVEITGIFKSNIYTDDEGNEYSGDKAYIDSDGYFFYDEEEKLTPDDYYWEYYKDEDGNLYYPISTDVAVFGKDGTIYTKSGKYYTVLFEFNEE
ncbi:MAG: hypothetical protein ACI4VI_01305 [Acutalibacteraceae bacterium]